MKSTVFASSLLWAVALAGVLRTESTSEKPAKIIDVKPRVRSTAKRQFIQFGPLALPPSKAGAKSKEAHGHGGGGIPGLGAAMDPDGFAFTKQLEGGLCTDCTILAGKIDIVFENGTRADIANGVYLHHVISSIQGKSQDQWVGFCPGSGSSGAAGGFDLSKFLPPGTDISKLLPPGLDLGKLSGLGGLAGRGGAGFLGGAVDEFTEYYTTPDGSYNSGYYMPPQVKASMSGEIINYLKEQQSVYIQFDIEYLPGRVGAEAIKAALSVEGCSFPGAQFKDSVRGKVVSSDYDISKNGTIISFRGHMHDGGTSVAAFVNNKLACNSTAVYGLAGGELVVDGKEWKTISEMKTCTKPFPVIKGDKIRLEATFDKVAHPARVSQGQEQENMGFMQMTFVEAAK